MTDLIICPWCNMFLLTSYTVKVCKTIYCVAEIYFRKNHFIEVTLEKDGIRYFHSISSDKLDQCAYINKEPKILFQRTNNLNQIKINIEKFKKLYLFA